MTEQEKHIKQILANSTEGATPDFTNAVLERIRSLSFARKYDQPLIPWKWQRAFLFTFGFVAITILGWCLLGVFIPGEAVTWIRSQELPQIGNSKLVAFILCFWIVFALNTYLGKRLLAANSGSHRDL